MAKTNKGGKPGLRVRRQSALKALEATYASFYAAKKDKPSWVTTRNGKIIEHRAKTFSEECFRLETEIAHLKELLKI